MTSFPLLVRCHSAVDVISCFSYYVGSQLVIVVWKSRTVVNWDSEETLGLFALSAAAYNGATYPLNNIQIAPALLHPILLCVGCLRRTWKILLDTLPPFQPLLKIWSTDGQCWLGPRFGKFFIFLYAVYHPEVELKWKKRDGLKKKCGNTAWYLLTEPAVEQMKFCSIVSVCSGVVRGRIHRHHGTSAKLKKKCFWDLHQRRRARKLPSHAVIY